MPRTTYSKIEQILIASEQVGALDIRELAKTIQEKKLDAFSVFRRDANQNIVKGQASLQSIARNIRLCLDFGLLEVDAENRNIHITSLGKSCLTGDKYRDVLGQAIIDYLDDNNEQIGFNFDDLRRVIKDQTAPSRQDIQRALGNGLALSEERFRRILFLLACCERIHYQDKRIYVV